SALGAGRATAAGIATAIALSATINFRMIHSHISIALVGTGSETSRGAAWFHEPKTTSRSAEVGIRDMNTARTIIDKLGLAPHPEGGWYRETWRAPAAESVR